MTRHGKSRRDDPSHIESHRKPGLSALGASPATVAARFELPGPGATKPLTRVACGTAREDLKRLPSAARLRDSRWLAWRGRNCGRQVRRLVWAPLRGTQRFGSSEEVTCRVGWRRPSDLAVVNRTQQVEQFNRVCEAEWGHHWRSNGSRPAWRRNPSVCWPPCCSVTSLAQPSVRSSSMRCRREALVSSTVKDLVAGSGLRFEDRGACGLKGLPDAWHLHAVDLASAA